MQMVLRRLESTQGSTPGQLSIGGAAQCYTLELPRLFEGKENVHQKTCILAGTYEVSLVMSEKFKRIMPLLVGVPERFAIEMHQGNTAADTEGCILVGAYRASLDEITGSAVAFSALFAKMLAATRANEKITIEII